jgi:hypothetical protein
MRKTTFTYKMPTGGTYRIEFRRTGLFAGHYDMRVLDRPECPFPLGYPAHLLEGARICVTQGREPKSLDQAKAVAFHWMSGFEQYRQTGAFPNGRARFDVKPAH